MDNNPFSQSDLNVSKLRFYSIGVVAQNKKLDTDIIDVTPVEELTMLEGELSSNKVNYKAKGVIADGSEYSSSVDSKVTIKASWLPIGSSNRISSPDVRRGESVMIYQFGDADKYYWTTLKQDCNLRKLETVIYAFSATTKESDSIKPNTSYFLEVSTHKKIVTFHTSKVNGEPFSYDVQINAKEGRVIITDDIGNTMTLDSAQNRLFFKNANDSIVDISKNNILLKSKENVQIVTERFNIVATETILEGSFSGNGTGRFAGTLQSNSLQTGDATTGNLTASVFNYP